MNDKHINKHSIGEVIAITNILYFVKYNNCFLIGKGDKNAGKQ